MNSYEQLLIEYDDKVHIVEKQFKSKAKGLCKGKIIGISKNIETTNEKACVLAEELGHYHTTVGNIIDLSDAYNRKQERQARLWGYNKLIGLRGLIKAHENGCTSQYEIAEYLNVTEEYLKEAVNCYCEKYGTYTTVDNYVLYFIPHLTVGKIV